MEICFISENKQVGVYIQESLEKISSVCRIQGEEEEVFISDFLSTSKQLAITFPSSSYIISVGGNERELRD